MIRISVLLVILLVAAFFRLYQLPELAWFGYDEARDARIVRDMLVNKDLTLLGPETWLGDKIIYFGPLHYYLISVPMALSKFDPLSSYYFTALLGVLTTFIIFLLTKSLLSTTFYAVFPIAVFYNRWAWNPNTIPLFSALALLFIKRKNYLLAGIFLGLTSQLHITAIIIFFIAIFWMMIKRVVKRDYFFLVIGFALGIAPIIAFDLTHDFLYLKSLINLKDLAQGTRTLTWHYFLWALPLVALGIKFIPRHVSNLILAISFSTSLYLLSSLRSDSVHSLQSIEQVSKLIADDQRKDKLSFNVASFVDADARATSYRFFLERTGLTPLGIGEYAISDHVYVITFDDQESVLYNETYEISSFKPKKVSKIWRVGHKNIYRLEK